MHSRFRADREYLPAGSRPRPGRRLDLHHTNIVPLRLRRADWSLLLRDGKTHRGQRLGAGVIYVAILRRCQPGHRAAAPAHGTIGAPATAGHLPRPGDRTIRTRADHPLRCRRAGNVKDRLCVCKLSCHQAAGDGRQWVRSRTDHGTHAPGFPEVWLPGCCGSLPGEADIIQHPLQARCPRCIASRRNKLHPARRNRRPARLVRRSFAADRASDLKPSHVGAIGTEPGSASPSVPLALERLDARLRR